MNAVARTTALLHAVDAYARDGADDWSLPADLLALRHLTECLARIVQAHPGVAEFAEGFAAQAAEAVGVVEPE